MWPGWEPDWHEDDIDVAGEGARLARGTTAPGPPRVAEPGDTWAGDSASGISVTKMA